jgi:Zn-dependent peptidase ImmA (M78 family)
MREAILSSVAGRLEACAEIERALDQEGDREALESSGAWDALERGAGPNIDGAIERADAVRAALWLRDFEPIRNPLGAIERLGVTVLLEPVQSERFTGLSVKSSQRLAVVVGAWPRLSQERVAFSAAHELGHLLMHESFGDGGRVELAVEEEEANAFAAQLLLPARAFEREWSQRRGQALADRVLGIKALYGVSFRTVLYQMDRAGYADARRAWRLFADQYWRVHRATLDGELEANRARPEAFSTTLLSQEPAPMRGGVLAACYLGRLARAARLRGVASQSTCAQALGLSLAEFDTLEFCWAEEAGQLNLFAQVQP